MTINHERVRDNVRKAETEDLLDRLTVYRAGMEPEALEIIEEELRSRGVNTPHIQAHEEQRDKEVLWAEPGLALPCSFCHKPAVAQGWTWQHIFFGLLPLFPRRATFCPEHLDRRIGGATNPGLPES
jgi:hypothetical protein